MKVGGFDSLPPHMIAEAREVTSQAVDRVLTVLCLAFEIVFWWWCVRHMENKEVEKDARRKCSAKHDFWRDE